MFKFKKQQTLLVDHGRVMCPLRGDIDVETCLGCKSLKAVGLDEHPSFITCEGWGKYAAEMIPATSTV